MSRPSHYASGAGRTPSFRAAAAAFHDGGLTPRAYLDALIERIEDAEDDLRAFVTLDLDAARAAADAAGARYAAGKPASPVDGLPIGLKDIIQTRDMPTQSGSPIFGGWTAERDAPVAAALRRGGAVIVGKTATTEFAYGAIAPTRNPYDRDRTPGTSSSGSAAAVGAGMLPVAIGTQLMSSVMRPASYCGHVGVKPSYGAIRQDAIHPFSPSGEHVGIHAHALEDAWAVLRYLSRTAGPIPGERGIEGPADLSEATAPTRLMRMYTTGWDIADEAVRAAFEAALARLADAGVEIVEPDSEPALAAVEADFSRADWCIAEIAAFEMRWPFFEYEAAGGAFHARISTLLERAHEITIDDYQAALDWKSGARARYQATRGTIDGMIGLTAPEIAPVGLENIGHPVTCSPASCLGVPAISLPLLEAEGLPLGLQLVGRHNCDAAMFAHAAWIDGTLGG